MTTGLDEPATARGRADRWLRDQLRAGRLAVGMALPAERTLAEAIGISRDTLRSALANWDRLGWIERRPGGRVRRLASAAEGVLDGGEGGLLDGAVVLLTDIRERPWEGEVGTPDERLARGLHAQVPAVLGRDDDLFYMYRSPLRRSHAEQVAAVGPRGVILAGNHQAAAEQRATWRALHDAGLPVVALDAARALDRGDRVRFDHAAATRLQVDALVARGCRRIMRLWPEAADAPAWRRERDRGYRESLSAAGLEVLPGIDLGRSGDLQIADHAEFALRVAERRAVLAPALAAYAPDAVLALSDRPALQVAAALAAEGRELPVAGFDAYWWGLPERRWAPALASTVELGVEPAVDALAAQLARRLADPDADETCAVVHPRLVEEPL